MVYTVSPRLSPVCGGLDLVIEGLDYNNLEKQNKTILLAIEGSSQRHICSTKYNQADQGVVAAIPEHEPAEECFISIIFFDRLNNTVETIPLGSFTYKTDQTQLLAVYLAQSVHDLESLEDWDEIKGDGFSLCDEDFASLDDRLSCAFHHLLLPDNWSLLGDNKEQMARETLYHFCVRLGLVKFMRLLFTKPGSKLCLKIPNRHNEFPRELADKRQHEELYRILSDVNAVDHYSQPLPETHDLEHGACLRYTEHHTVNIDIDVSNEHTKQPLEADVLLFAEPLHADTINQRFDSKRSSSVGHDNSKFINEARLSNVSLHLTDSRSNSCPDVNDEPLPIIKIQTVKMRQRRNSDDIDIMPDVKRRSIIAQHLSDSLNGGDRRHSWHESEQNLLSEEYTDGSSFIPRSRSYEHIDEPDLSNDESGEPAEIPVITATPAEVIQIDKFLSTSRKSPAGDSDRRRAIVIKEKSPTPVPTLDKDQRLMDQRRHELPQKLLNVSNKTSGNSTRKMSFLNNFLPGRNHDRKTRKAVSPRPGHKQMPSIQQSDTDTDSENKKPYFTNLTKSNSNLERNASNSSADFTERLFNKSDPLKETMDQNDSDISSDFENDNELNTLEEAENWWSFTQGQREEETTKKEIKRQENIYEFIHTELNHSKTLRIMQKIFIGRMKAELGYTSEQCTKFFPALKELSDISREFLRRLRIRQKEETPIIEHFADVLFEFWNSDWGERKASAYGRFCARQHDSLQLYKDELKNNKRFSSLMRKYKSHRLTKRLDIPDCIQLATQRLTKYPLLLENILKNTEDSTEKQKTLEALERIQQIAQSVNGEMCDYERTKQLEDISINIDKTSSTKYNEKRFNRKHLNQSGRTLINKYEVQYKVNNSKEKYTEVLLLILEDILVLLHNKTGSYSFVQNAQALNLKHIHVRENATDNTSIYIVPTQVHDRTGTSELSIWNLRSISKEKIQEIIQQIELAKEMAPAAGVENRRKNEQKHKEMKQKAKNILAELEHFDHRIKDLYMQRTNVRKQLCQVYAPVQQGLFQIPQDTSQPMSHVLGNMKIICSKLQSQTDSSQSQSRPEIVSELLSSIDQLDMHVQNQNLHHDKISAELNEYRHLSGFRGSRGVLEADQKRYALKHEIIVKELEAKKQKHEDGLNQLEEEKINLQNREKELERKEEALERNRLELQNNWNHYQKEAEALRTAANSQTVSDLKIHSLTSSQSAGSLHHAPKKNRNDRSKERRSTDPRTNKNKESIPIHLSLSAVNQSANPRASVRSNGGSNLFSLAESTGKSPSNQKLPSGVSKLASSTSKGRMKTK